MSQQIIEKINHLKQDRGAVILAHNYQPGEIQELADFCGDSLGLSIKASQTEAVIIVFCGVHFMAETAAILSPDKTVLLPDASAGCPMADMITAEQLRELKSKYPDALVVCYVNSSAEVKAESDYCCTSANAVGVVNSVPTERRIIFVPDKYLGSFVAGRTGRDIILWQGYCPSHVIITAEEIQTAKQKYPQAVVLAHPECTEPVRELSDQLLSTSQMLRFARESDAEEFIIATEIGIIHTLQKQNPDKKFIAASENAVCPNMKKISLEKLLWALEDMQYKITVPEQIRRRASKALERMVAVV